MKAKYVTDERRVVQRGLLYYAQKRVKDSGFWPVAPEDVRKRLPMVQPWEDLAKGTSYEIALKQALTR